MRSCPQFRAEAGQISATRRRAGAGDPPLTAVEAAHLVSIAEYHSRAVCAARTGLRLGELLSLQWGDVDWNGRFFVVQRNIVRGVVAGSAIIPIAGWDPGNDADVFGDSHRLCSFCFSADASRAGCSGSRRDRSRVEASEIRSPEYRSNRIIALTDASHADEIRRGFSDVALTQDSWIHAGTNNSWPVVSTRLKNEHP
jgi:hypothetical protein